MRLDRRIFLLGTAAFGAAALAPRRSWARGLDLIPPPDRELMAPVPGGRVYVRLNGRLDGPRPPLIIAHGGPGGVHASYLNALALADERAVILYDQLDSGQSDHPGDPANWVVGRFVDELDAIRTALGIRRWHMLGHSWGGTIGLEYGARRDPALVSLILASPLVSTRSWIADADILRRQLPADVQQVLRGCDPPAPITPLCDDATTKFYAAFNRREQGSAAIRAYALAHPQLALQLNKRIYEAMWGTSEFVATGSLRNYDGEPLLARLDGARTLFIAGQYDEARPATEDVFARRAGAEFAVIPGAAHSIFSDRPEETLGILRPWLRSKDAA